jgi:hypothetical protein
MPVVLHFVVIEIDLAKFLFYRYTHHSCNSTVDYSSASIDHQA